MKINPITLPKISAPIPKPQKIADSNFLGFKNWQQLKSAFFGGPSICPGFVMILGRNVDSLIRTVIYFSGSFNFQVLNV
ncbi:MAG: hypothetical protein LBS83_00195 [Holosporales bacterium]|nr:hypothetical protein [Holosporales bacterium]